MAAKKPPRRDDARGAQKPGAPANPGLSAADAALLASYPAEYDRLPDQSVPRILAMAREVLAAARHALPALAACTRVCAAEVDGLEADAARLVACEDAWSRARDLRANSEDIAEAEGLKADALAALDYWLEGDAAVAARVARIREGTGIADLADDLEKLAALLDEHGTELQKADLIEGARARMQELARNLSSGLAGRRSDNSSRALLSLRNLAFHALVARMDAICAAGRYAFRKEPRRAKLFASVATRKRAQRRARIRKPVPAPDA